jgi:hypothetical protein
VRTELWLPIGPFFKLFIAPLTNEYRPLLWIDWYPASSKATILRTVFNRISQTMNNFKVLPAMSTLKGYSFSASKMLAFKRAILSSALIFEVYELGTAVLTGVLLRWHFDTLRLRLAPGVG